MEHPTFSEAGKAEGIEIWTIENFEPVPIEAKYYGKFYNGDSYIVLKTTGAANSTLSHDAHFWLGSKTTQDKMGSAAIWTTTLDDMLGGKAVHHREVQGHESSLFLGYFKPAIRYLEGGNESGFTEVETNAGVEKRLLKLSGCDNMRIEEVPAEASSLTQEHCFILEVDHDIFVLMPEGAKATQRRKIISVANSLRDDDHNGRATIEIIDDFSSDEDFSRFFEALGSGSKDDIASDDSSSTYARADMSAVYLYRVLTGEEIELVTLNKPFKQTQLSSDEVYILDTPCSGVYVWLGSGVSAEVKKSYHQIADQFLTNQGYPAWVNVTRVSEGAESATFRQYFHSWESATAGMAFGAYMLDSDAGYYSEDTDQAVSAARLIGKSAAARGYMPDQGDGSLSITRVSGEREDVTEQFLSGVSVLYQSEVYVIKYQYDDNGTEAYVVYCWVGADSSTEDRTSAIDLVKELEEELEGNLTVVRVPQYKEPKHLLSVFKGSLAIVYGGKDTDYQPTNSKGSYEDDNIRLFRVEGNELGVDMRAVQVPETASSLEDDDVYVLETRDNVYVWVGKESNSTEKEAVTNFVRLLVGESKEVALVDQGDEPAEFWEALGGDETRQEAGWRMTVNRRIACTHTLSAVTVTVKGKIRFEDLDTNYTQQDLSDDGVYILDTGEELYIWQGQNIPERVTLARSDIIKEYIADDGLDRTVDSILVVFVKQNQEPGVFKKHFTNWDDDMWTNLSSYEDIKNETLAQNN